MANGVRVPHIKPIDLSNVSKSLDNIFSGGQRLTDEVTDLGKKAARIALAVGTSGASEVVAAVGGVSDEGKRFRQDLKTGIEDVTGQTLAKKSMALAESEGNARLQAEADQRLRAQNSLKFAQSRMRQRSASGQGRQSTILTSGLGSSSASANAGKTLLGQ